MNRLSKIFLFLFLVLTVNYVYAQCPTITLNDTLADDTINTTYTGTITASGGNSPYTYVVTDGALPDGLSLSAGGALSGTSTVADTFTFEVTATDEDECEGVEEYEVIINCPTITLDDDLSNQNVNVSYADDVEASGGNDPYTYAVTAGALPDGLTLEADGDLVGTPTVVGVFEFTITATDDDSCTGLREYEMIINTGAPTTVSTFDVRRRPLWRKSLELID